MQIDPLTVGLSAALLYLAGAALPGLAQPPVARRETHSTTNKQATLPLCNLCARPTLLTGLELLRPIGTLPEFPEADPVESLGSVRLACSCSSPPEAAPGNSQSIPDETRRHKLIAGLTSGRLNQPKRSLDWSCK